MGWGFLHSQLKCALWTRVNFWQAGRQPTMFQNTVQMNYFLSSGLLSFFLPSHLSCFHIFSSTVVCFPPLQSVLHCEARACRKLWVGCGCLQMYCLLPYCCIGCFRPPVFLTEPRRAGRSCEKSHGTHLGINVPPCQPCFQCGCCRVRVSRGSLPGGGGGEGPLSGLDVFPASLTEPLILHWVV